VFGKTNSSAVDLTKLGGDSQYAIDYLGDKNANTLTGTHSDEIFVAGHKIYLNYRHLGQPDRHLQSNHPNHRH
jgi:hypothetical protein